jgi:hypothetical protein
MEVVNSQIITGKLRTVYMKRFVLSYFYTNLDTWQCALTEPVRATSYATGGF